MKTHQRCCFVVPFNTCFICLQCHHVAGYGNDQLPFSMIQIIQNHTYQDRVFIPTEKQQIKHIHV